MRASATGMHALPRAVFARRLGLALSILIALFRLLCGDAWSAGAPPNVILVVSDDQGYGDLSGTGNPVLKTPNMDRLAAEGIRLSNFHVDSYCTPTRAALMTGRYAHRVGGWGTTSGRNMLRDGEVTMAEVFRQNGYRTGLFGKWHLGACYPYRPIDRGFEEWLGHGNGGTGCAGDHWGNDRVNDVCIHNGGAEPTSGYEADVFFDAAMRFIRTQKGHPFFVYLATYNPHAPCSLAASAWADPYRGKVPLQTAYFLASIARVDQNLGRLRAFLAEEKLSDDTLLIFLSDNGTAQGEKVFNAGMRGKKLSPYDGGHRVPCFIRWPAGGLDKPAGIDQLTAHIDLLPTLVDLCGLKLPRPVSFDGMSLKPLLANPQASWPERTLVLGTPPNDSGPNPQPPPHGTNCSVMTDRWRLVNESELYDVLKDPGQQHDLALQHPDVVRQLQSSYEHYWTSVSAGDKGWRGRPILGSPQCKEVELCGEDWYPTAGRTPWNQAMVANGVKAFGYWTVRFAAAGVYRFEIRRWPREIDAPICGVPAAEKTVDAYLDDRPVRGLLYGGAPRTLPVARARLRIGTNLQEAAVAPGDKVKEFTATVDAGAAEIEATLLDARGNPLCGAYYVAVRKN
jgi:arylsulfatase A-like enzyme